LSTSIMFSGNGELTPQQASNFSVEAETKGFGGLWFGETTLRDASVLATVAACATKTISLGTSILNVFTRSPGQLALLASTINELSKGRFTLGLGVSTAAIIEKWHGQEFGGPVPRLEESVQLLRRYFSGERFSHKGAYYSPANARLKPNPAPKIALAALNDQMIRKAASLADRIILNLYPTDRIEHAIDLIDKSIGSKSRPVLSVMLYAYVVGDNEDGLNAAKDLVAFYASAPAYSSLFASMGFAREAKAMMDAWQARDRDAVKRIVSSQMIDRLLVLGNIGDLRERVKIYHENGVSDIFIAPSPFGDYHANIREVLRGF
jgi:probable F420-dependent oxidoreductase